MKTPELRLTVATLKVLSLLRDDVRREWSGAQIARETELGPGTVYPLLIRFEHLGLVTSRWENIDPAEAGRPRKRFYKISGLGARVAQEAVAAVHGTGGRVPSWAK